MTKPDKNGWMTIESAEAWRPVVGWPRYEVSNRGNVRTVEGKTVGQWPSDRGYMIVRLSQPRSMARVHRLVARAFLPCGHTSETVNHKDGCKANNRVENLEWATRSENVAHAIRNHLGPYSPPRLYGRDNPKHKLSDDDVRDAFQRLCSGEPFRQIARSMNVDRKSLKRRFGILLPEPPVSS